ncbi:MAG: aspartate-semialdehyde dehydrogenase [Armatimonadota bacterium]|nr:MAG: aspartate-semialdehyde dehydrogenase [Armatimonadota bacterium]
MSQAYNVVVVGRGAVGRELLRVLAQRSFPASRITVLARSAGAVEVDGRSYEVRPAAAAEFDGCHIALFAGTEGEKGAAVQYAPEATKRGAVVIDNGNDFRMDPAVPLVVPEVNREALRGHDNLIANPNCSTIQMVVALKPIHDAVGIKRAVVASYQAASGAGAGAVAQLEAEIAAVARGEKLPAADTLPQQLACNVFPHIGGFDEDGYCSEEVKLARETHKILGDDSVGITATTCRVPVFNGHCEAVNLELREELTPAKAKKLLATWEPYRDGYRPIRVVDEPSAGRYPMPVEVSGTDEVFVGRFRRDASVAYGLNLWVAADNLRKGAALNAVQIAEQVIAMGLLTR